MRKELQEMDHVDCFFLLADYHALSDNAHDIQKVRQNVREVAIDWMSV